MMRFCCLCLLLGAFFQAGYAAPAVPDPIEPAPTVESVSGIGPYAVRAYALTLPKNALFARGRVYYPRDRAAAFGAVALCPGYAEGQADVDWFGPRLASHGFAVLTLDVRHRTRDLPAERSAELMAALAVLRSEGGRAGGPLSGRVDQKRFAVMGHSMGGGAALIAAQAHGPELKAAIALAPWCESPGAFPTLGVPTLIVAADGDSIAPASAYARPFYAGIPASTHKMYVEIKGAGHGVANGSADGSSTGLSLYEGAPTDRQRGTISRYCVSWLKLYVDGDERYRGLLYGPSAPADAASLSRFESGP